MADLRTRIRVDNSKNAADQGLTVAIADLTDLFAAETDNAFGGRYRFRIDHSKGAAAQQLSISIADINTILNGGEIEGFSSKTRLRLDPSDAKATHSVSFAEVGALIVIESEPEGYTASAVHLDGATSLKRLAGIACTDNSLFSLVGWVKLSSGDVGGNNLFTVDPDNNYSPNLQFIDASDPNFTGALTISNADYSGSGTITANVNGAPWFTEDEWFCIIISGDASDPAKFKVYRGDTDVTDLDDSVFDGLPFTIATNGLPFWFGDDSFGNFVSGDYADWRIMPGISLLNGSGDIPEATRRLFIDASGKPVDPAVATASLGAPAILFSGNAAAFATNQGTGGAFTLTGSLTNAGTSPSD